MKYLQMVFIAFLFVFALNFVTTGDGTIVSADNDDYEEYYQDSLKNNGDRHHEKDSPYEEMGENAGWGTVIAMVAAGLIFPIRKSIKSVITNFPGAKNIFISISKFFGKYHIPIGVIALVLAVAHGVTMYLSEGELEGDGMIGLASFGLMVIAGILGFILNKNRKSKGIRSTHSIFIAFATLIGFFHILAS